jgi:dienelactone hydrolase
VSNPAKPAVDEKPWRPTRKEAWAGVRTLLTDRWRVLVSRHPRRRTEFQTSAGARPGTFYFPPSDRPLPAPAVLVLHTSGGRSAHEDAIGAEFAGLGYVALIVSYCPILRRPVLENAEKTAELERIVRAARDCLAAEPAADASRLAVVGYSLGGHFALHLALTGAVSAAVVYFGIFPEDSGAAGRLTAPVLVHQGNLDSKRFTASADAFASEARRLGKACQLFTYESAGHQFDLFQPQSQARHVSWQRTLEFLAHTLS